MLNTGTRISGRIHGEATSTPSEYDLAWVFGAILRYRALIASLVLLCMALAVIHVATRAPSFKATSHIQLTNLRLNFSRDDAFFAETATDPSFLETQVQIMRSARVALAVVDAVGLSDRPATRDGGWGLDHLMGELRAMFRPPEDTPGLTSGLSDARLRALKVLQNGFTAERLGLSNVVEASFASEDPELAARIVNEYVKAYIAEQNAVRADAALSGSSWLRERLREVGPRARVISAAQPPSDSSNVRGLLIIAAAGMLGGGAGFAGALALAFADRRVRTPEHAVRGCGAECFGIVPRFHARRWRAAGGAAEGLQPSSPLVYVGEHPNSRVADVLRTVKVAGDECFGGAGLRSLAVISTFGNEGRTTIAANYATIVAGSGLKVLLVDCDPHSARSLTASIGAASASISSAAKSGVPAKSHGPHTAPLPVVHLRDRLDFLSLASGWKPDSEKTLDALKGRYDYVVLDLPPLTSVADVRSAARDVDAFLLVIQWGRVTPDEIEAALSMAGGVQDRLLGSLLNNVKLRQTRWIPSARLAFFRASMKPSPRDKRVS